MNHSTKKRKDRIRRHGRVRAKIAGTKEVPRVSVFRSNNHIFVQVIDDTNNQTLLSSKVISKGKSTLKGTKTELAGKVGEMIGAKAKEKGINQIVFDRGGFKYHGRVKALAEGLRSAGIKF